MDKGLYVFRILELKLFMHRTQRRKVTGRMEERGTS